MVQTNTIQLNNELFTNKFKLVFKEIKSAELLCTGAQLPSLEGTPIEVPNQLNKMYVQGNKLNYTPLTLTFKVDENLNSYKEIFNWITAIHRPQSYQQFVDFQNTTIYPKSVNKYVIGLDASLITLKNSDNFNFEATFVHMFPTSLSPLDFTMNNEQVMFATATFQFDYFFFK